MLGYIKSVCIFASLSNQNYQIMDYLNILPPEYLFILENLDFLTTDVKLGNIGAKFPERDKFSLMQNQSLINFKRWILRDYAEGKHELIYFTAEQWQTIVNKIKEAENV